MMKLDGKRQQIRRWQGFYISFIEAGLCDPDRKKTLKALQTLSEKILQKDLKRIPPFTTVFAPSPNTLGLADPWFHPGGPERTGCRIYLSPRLERMSQARVNSVVAHEFAHVILGHDGDSFPAGKVPKKYKDLPAEKAADALIESWGYRAADSWK
jgi:hypothetical protein